MNNRVRRAIVALVLSGTALTASGAAEAGCALAPCDGLTFSVEPGGGPIFGEGGSGGSGAPCTYRKYTAPPPSDWQGNPNDPAPYLFNRTKGWGDSPQHPQIDVDHLQGDWDDRDCVLLCMPSPEQNGFGVVDCVTG